MTGTYLPLAASGDLLLGISIGDVLLMIAGSFLGLALTWFAGSATATPPSGPGGTPPPAGDTTHIQISYTQVVNQRPPQRSAGDDDFPWVVIAGIVVAVAGFLAIRETVIDVLVGLAFLSGGFCLAIASWLRWRAGWGGAAFASIVAMSFALPFVLLGVAQALEHPQYVGGFENLLRAFDNAKLSGLLVGGGPSTLTFFVMQIAGVLLAGTVIVLTATPLLGAVIMANRYRGTRPAALWDRLYARGSRWWDRAAKSAGFGAGLAALSLLLAGGVAFSLLSKLIDREPPVVSAKWVAGIRRPEVKVRTDEPVRVTVSVAGRQDLTRDVGLLAPGGMVRVVPASRAPLDPASSRVTLTFEDIAGHRVKRVVRMTAADRAKT